MRCTIATAPNLMETSPAPSDHAELERILAHFGDRFEEEGLRRVGRVRDLALAVGTNRRGGLRRERERESCGLVATME